jgi:sporulation protein YlmC with PRC-barrel domain/predicted transcriptional regulator
MHDILFLTELVGLKVYDLRGRGIGRVKDAALVPLIDVNRVDRFLIGGALAWFTIRHDQVRSIDLNGIHLADEKLTPYHAEEYMLRVVRDLLDQQIIDAEGRKVVRVTDITFRIENQHGHPALTVDEIDIGLRSIFRRLVQGVLPRPWVRRLQTPIPPHSIDWAKCSILEADPMRRLRLNISNRLLEEMHPADLAEIVEELAPDDREAIFSTIDAEVAAETLSEVDPDIQASILESLDTEKAAEIVEEMSPDEAADALTELEKETAGEILEEMEREDGEGVRELLSFRADTAGGLMNTEYVALDHESTVGDALAALRRDEDLMETLNVLFLTDGRERLTGVVPLARLLLQDSATPLEALAVETAISVQVSEHQDRVAELFDKYNLLCLPVVGEHGVLCGVITADDVISLLRNE